MDHAPGDKHPADLPPGFLAGRWQHPRWVQVLAYPTAEGEISTMVLKPDWIPDDSLDALLEVAYRELVATVDYLWFHKEEEVSLLEGGTNPEGTEYWVHVSTYEDWPRRSAGELLAEATRRAKMGANGVSAEA